MKLGSIDKAVEELSTTAKLQKKIRFLEAELKTIITQRDESKRYAAFASEVASLKPTLFPWERAAKSSKQHRVTATAFLSDCHFDEVVTADQVEGVNEYNRKIAAARLENFFDNTVELSKHYSGSLKIEGLVLPMGGDIFSGNIHDELKETNESTILESILYWSEHLASGIEYLSKNFDHVFIPAVVGNHSRQSKKPRAKGRVRENFDWFLYKILERELRHLPNVRFQVSESADCQYSVYNTKYLLTHGDQFRGGGGIAGLLSPLMIGESRKRKRQQAVQKPFDYLIIGHWHQRAMFKNIIVNGSLVGYDEYAFVSNFDYTPPQQSFWLTDEKHGITVTAPIHVQGRNERYRA